MRIIPIAVALVIYLILSLPIMGILWIARLFSPKATFAMQRVICAALSFLGWLSGTKVTTKGTENIPLGQPLMFIANHQSFFDVVLGFPQLTKLKIPLFYISKVGFRKYPLLNLNIAFLGCPFIDKHDLKQSIKAIKTAGEMVSGGSSVFVFPEGERNRSGEYPLLPFFDGSFSIAKRTGVPVVPVAYTGTAALLENHFPWIKPGHVTIEYGKPVLFSDLSAEEKKHAGAYFENVIAEMVKNNLAA